MLLPLPALMLMAARDATDDPAIAALLGHLAAADAVVEAREGGLGLSASRVRH